MEKQEYKISDGVNEWFFWAHSFKTAYGHARHFLNRNKDNGKKYNLYRLNDGIGNRWILVRQ